MRFRIVPYEIGYDGKPLYKLEQSYLFGWKYIKMSSKIEELEELVKFLRTPPKEV